MATISRYSVLLAGVVSPVAAVALDKFFSKILTRLSTDPEHDWFFRLSWLMLAMTVPFLFTLYLAWQDRRHRRALSGSAKVGVLLAACSLLLIAWPARSAILRWKQLRDETLSNVPAPPFATVDIFGNREDLADQKNKVVLVDIWASWCEPCRAEMPELDELYRSRKNEGLMVFGISNEDATVQRRFLEQVPVSYPLLTLNGQVPEFYRDIVRYPAVFLIDRHGRLQPAPGPEQPFEKLEAAVDGLLRSGT
jgi:thiol-disulfide isomerase/thioredoxin